MNKKMNHLDQISKDNPFKTPEGYFEGLTAQIMSGLPEKAQEETNEVSMWTRVKPWVYMAAMFAGIFLMVKVFVGSPDKSYGASTLNLTSAAEIEDFYNYYEEQLENSIYSDVFYNEADDYYEEDFE
jgi:hypothetical protein